MLKTVQLKMFLLSLVLLLTLACNEESGLSNSADPSDLKIEVNTSDAEPGQVIISAFANNAERYTFDPGDGTELLENTSGKFEYTYARTDFYGIEIRAYGVSGRYVDDVRQISIDLGNAADDTDDYSTPAEYAGWKLIWQDEFTGPGLNAAYWTHEIGDGCDRNLCGWGNAELQYYRSENSTVEDGYLTITAKKESMGGKAYTSSRIITKSKFDFQYGRVDIRAKLPKGQGLWPALWMLGANIDQVGWPACGEIDIMEVIGGGVGRDDKTYGTIHYEDNGKADFGGSTQITEGTFNDKFHVFTLIWDDQKISWLLDDQVFHEASISEDYLTEFHSKFFFIFNIAVGGNWPGTPNANTEFPQEMQVDYIRVFQPE